MAKINPANVAPDAYPRIRGVVLTRTTEHHIIVQKWPKKRGPSQTWKAQYLTQQFGLAGRMAANAEPMSYETAKYWSQGTVWLPRDILVKAAYGNLIEIIGTDGTVFVQADHSAPEAPYVPRPKVLQWQPNLVNGLLSAAVSTSAFAFKGVCFEPTVAMNIYALQMNMTAVNAAVYKAVCCTLSGANVITAIVAGQTKQLGGTARKIYEFDLQTALVAGSRYAIMLGRTDGGNTYALPVSNATGGNIMFPGVDLGFARLAQATPTIGQTVTIGAGAFAQNLLIDY